MMRAKLIVLAAAMMVLGAAAPQAASSAASAITADKGTRAALSVLTYNVKGLPWPVARNRSADLAAIGDRLARLRGLGSQPHIVALQEAFTDEAKAIGLRGGYAFRALGPSADAVQSMVPGGFAARMAVGASWLRGETEGHVVDSGLMVLSDYPVTRVQQAAFPAGACAGYDCLANKGVLMVTIVVPGLHEPVDVLTTHLNSRRASGVSDQRSLLAYIQQVEFLGRFVRGHHDPDHALIMTGDLNVGSAPGRRQSLFAVVADLPANRSREPLRAALPDVMKVNHLDRLAQADANWTLKRARDWEFFSHGHGDVLEPSGLTMPFGTDSRGKTLSDHMGFTIAYR